MNEVIAMGIFVGLALIAVGIKAGLLSIADAIRKVVEALKEER